MSGLLEQVAVIVFFSPHRSLAMNNVPNHCTEAAHAALDYDVDVDGACGE